MAERLGALLRAGDLVLLTGGLGAGKTTFTQGLALGLRVRGPITSPTFVVSREHPSLVGGPPLVHVDAYRLQGAAELDDLDLDAELAEAVTVVEWGHGLAEALSEDYLELTLDRAGDGSGGSGDGPGGSGGSGEEPGEEPGDVPRIIVARGHGARWAAVWSQIAALA
ncbi:tRNA (adenosine(37)-N6)-threonylcarbamoyltransferase complex ATPase subunit type 1 TsaE [Barrientosiimonas humi]|uniref:tRNA (adenosine(37)-N6)-threonylcarbamoyltransferase complex ATPase subunit type 1 TsaE n=1 Tax=Barrientosiimonas humi TaxID=999931 RepID=UPI001F025BF0|nr:tRNA (adenosine(37)-N6)-threonylcarbamoyltransferase complex ATPase subunit type 1 TsaE [Barrientosiimonas humi]